MEIFAFVLYLSLMLGIGLLFFIKGRKNRNDSEYFLGGRKLGPFVTAMSAQASDMSGWLLMGFPGSILLAGFGKIWIAIGLALGSYLSWLLVAGRLRRFSQVAGGSITIPQYLNNRFKASNKLLQVVSASIFFVCFTVYVASGLKAGGYLFQMLFNAQSTVVPTIICAAVIILYTFLGGFKAVCWTDLFQGLLMLCALIILPVVLFFTNEIDFGSITSTAPNFFNLLPSGKFDWASVSQILSGLAWGLGYFGMPHILIRFMAIKNSKMVKTSRRFAFVWIVATLGLAVLVGVLGRILLPELLTGNSELVFVNLVRMVFPPFIAGILLSAILAASMSTADSQLLVASSAITSDIYKPLIRKQASSKEVNWVGRIVVVVIAIIATFIAINPNSGSIMNLVENAWAGFGAAFGPVIILSLYWKRLTYSGAVASIISGAVTVILWIAFLSKPTGLYELLPGFVVAMIVAIVVSLLTKKPTSEITDMFALANSPDLNEEIDHSAVYSETLFVAEQSSGNETCIQNEDISEQSELEVETNKKQEIVADNEQVENDIVFENKEDTADSEQLEEIVIAENKEEIADSEQLEEIVIAENKEIIADSEQNEEIAIAENKEEIADNEQWDNNENIHIVTDNTNQQIDEEKTEDDIIKSENENIIAEPNNEIAVAVSEEKEVEVVKIIKKTTTKKSTANTDEKSTAKKSTAKTDEKSTAKKSTAKTDEKSTAKKSTAKTDEKPTAKKSIVKIDEKPTVKATKTVANKTAAAKPTEKAPDATKTKSTKKKIDDTLEIKKVAVKKITVKTPKAKKTEI